MSSFSRGACSKSLSRITKDGQRLFNRQRSPLTCRPRPIRITLSNVCRSFATRSRGSRPAGERKLVPRPPAPLEHISRAPGAAKSGFAQMLAQKDSPTTLYSNVGNADYTALIAAVAGGYCIMYGATWMYDACFVEHPGLWRPVNWMNGFGGLVIAGIGASILTRTYGQVGMIRAIPTRGPRSSGGPRLSLLVEGRNWMSFPAFWKRPVKWVPLWRPDMVERPVDMVRMSDRIVDIKRSFTPLSSAEKKKAKEELLARDAAGGKILFAPIKTAFGRFRSTFLKVLIGEGYVKLLVEQDSGKTKTFKLDVKSGWLLDEGEALDRLLESSKSR